MHSARTHVDAFLLGLFCVLGAMAVDPAISKLLFGGQGIVAVFVTTSVFVCLADVFVFMVDFWRMLIVRLVFFLYG